MATPTVSASLNASSFAPGDAMTLTVNYGDADNQPVTVTVTVTDAAGNTSAPVQVQAVIADPVTVTVADPDRTWTVASDNGAVAVFTATA